MVLSPSSFLYPGLAPMLCKSGHVLALILLFWLYVAKCLGVSCFVLEHSALNLQSTYAHIWVPLFFGVSQNKRNNVFGSNELKFAYINIISKSFTYYDYDLFIYTIMIYTYIHVKFTYLTIV